MGNPYTIRALNRCVGFVAMAFLLPVSLPSNAQSTFDVSILAGACVNCHGPEGRGSGAIPSLAGRSENTLKDQLIAFKSDMSMSDTTIMNRLAKGYADVELIALAQYFSKISALDSTSVQGDKK